MNVFISYAREDIVHAHRLHDALVETPGVTPWLDMEKLTPGVKWEHEIMQAIEESDFVIILLSTHSINKVGFVQKEMIEAIDRLKYFSPGKIFIIPARINDCEPKHPELKGLQWVDLFPNFEQGFSKILLSIFREIPTKPSFTIPVIKDLNIELKLDSVEKVLRRLNKEGDLQGCDVMELDLSGINFKGINLSGASLVGT